MHMDHKRTETQGAVACRRRGQGGGRDDEDEDMALVKALAAPAAAWRCGACTFEDVGAGVQVSRSVGWSGVGLRRLIVLGLGVCFIYI